MHRVLWEAQEWAPEEERGSQVGFLEEVVSWLYRREMNGR